MGFLYDSPAGAVDLAVLALACLAGAVFGAPQIRRLSAVMAAVFLYDRAILNMVDGNMLPFLASLGCLASALFVVRGCTLKIARAFALLSVVKMAVYTAMLAGLLGFDAMATCAAIAAYCQLLLILGGATDGNPGGRIYRGASFAGSRIGSGCANFLASLANRGAISRRADMPASGPGVSSPLVEKSREVAQ